LMTDVAPGCESSSSSSQPLPDIFVRDTCITGPIWFKEGYNCRIRQDSGRNTITIGAGIGLGEGEPCEEVPLTAEEAPPGDSPFLTGGPGCNQVVQSLNGVGGADLVITAGAGYRIQADPGAPHKLVVERALGDFALCADLPEPSSSVSASASSQSSSSKSQSLQSRSSSSSSGVIVLP
jgi:hypothetical protein